MTLRDLDERLKRARAEREGGPGGGGSSGFGAAFRIAAELVSGLAVGVGIGWALDRWLGTGPWLMILFFFLGAAAGVLNVWRTAKGYGLAAGYRKPANGTDAQAGAQAGKGNGARAGKGNGAQAGARAGKGNGEGRE